MYWNHFLNRIRISGLKVFVVSLVFILILALALMLRALTGKTEVDAFQFVAEMNQALSSGDPETMDPYVQDGTQWSEHLAADLTPLEAKLQALTIQEMRLQVTDFKTDRLRNQMDLNVKVEAPDLSSLENDWITDAQTKEEVIEAYALAIKELPEANSEDLSLMVDDVLGHVGSQAKVVEVTKLAEALTAGYRSELEDMRPLLANFEAPVNLVKPTKATTPKVPAGPIQLRDDEIETQQPSEESSTEVTTEESITQEPTTVEATTESTTTEPTTSTISTPETPRKTTAPATTPQVPDPTPPTARPTTALNTRVLPTTAPSTRPTPAPTYTPAPTTLPNPTTMPTQTPTQAPTTLPSPQYPQIGHYYTVNSVKEDLVQIARQAYSAYAYPEDYVYLIIEYNGLQIVDGQVFLYYGQTIYLPVP